LHEGSRYFLDARMMFKLGLPHMEYTYLIN
jgi:hypothetical protein